MSTSLVCVLAACCWPTTNDKEVADAIKQCMDDDDHTAHSAMRTLAAQAEDDEMWVDIVMTVARKFGHKQWRKKDGQRTDAATQLLLLMDLMPLCDNRRALNTSEQLLSFARDEANANQMRNALVVWNSFAGKFDLRVGSRMLTDDMLCFLMDNANHRYTTDAEVCMHALLALEKFSKTGADNARRVSEMGYFERLEELLSFTTDHQLRLVCEWGLAHGPTRRAMAHMTNTDAARKRKRSARTPGMSYGGRSDSDSDREENTPGREKKPKNLITTTTTSAVTTTTTGGETGSGQHNTARRGSKSSRSRRRREEEEAAAAAAAAAAALQGDNSDERVADGSDDDAYALDHFDMDLENRLPLGKQVKLNYADRTNFVKLASDSYEVRNDSASFGSIRANCYVSSVDRNGRTCRGKWYYEVTLRTGGIMQIGWATKDSIFKPEEGSGIGDDFSSYAYDGCRRQAWHAASPSPCGRKERRWKAGDVVGCLFDTRSGVMAFTLNGKFSRELGDRTFVGVRHSLAFYPALSLGAFQQCRFNFGSEPFKYKPADYESVNEFVTRYDIPLEEPESAAEGERPGGMESASSKGALDAGDACEQLDEDELCKICYAQASEIKLHPCGHQEICFACSIRLTVCPVCRSPIENREHVNEAPSSTKPQSTATKPSSPSTHQHHQPQPVLVQL